MGILIKPITTIINLSLESGTFPLSFEEAHVIALLKNSNLPVNNLTNYRPASNLSFISKVIEKVVSNRLQAHMNSNKLNNPMQSASRKSHSTETALFGVHNDTSVSLYEGHVTALTLLDLSAAFDCCFYLDNEMNPADSARNLGVIFDSCLNFRQHISQVSSSCFYHFKDLKRIRKNPPLALEK